MELSKQLAFKDDIMVTGAIAITDLQQPKGQRWFDVKDLFEDYQERVKERAQLEAKRLAQEPMAHTWGQAEGGVGPGNVSKGKGKEKATNKEDELADNVDDDENEGEELTLSPHDPLPTPCLFFCRATPKPRPSFKASSPLVNKPQLSPPSKELQVKFKPFFATVTSLLNESGDVKVPVQSDTPLVAETPEVINPNEWSTANFIEHLQVLEARAKDEEFELEQVYWLLEMLVRQVTHWIESAWARWEEL
ncbi:hypothetical protein F5J12DRAFT_898791 [Pisolithus orientalis]|uniref:uncharacterized protein n=1 Tax=Pisolithus orientalis TaxID=936130 RepID=UPI0022249C46|nr:uncharacterized protein F5J12DRAFT_898791 [Pisolithus orientalis]KAI5986268.1 hypothetical protein F5J12DRAFT_898791 [Pisolithus orientalis]